MAVAAQGLHIPSASSRTPLEILGDLGCVQIDTINVVRRSHELVMLARGASSEAARAFASHEDKASFFEYWAHAAAFTPVELWPLFAFRRRRIAARGWRGPDVDPQACVEVRQLADEHSGVTVSDLGGAAGNGWERSSPRKWAAEWLWATGEFACVRRRGWKRVYEPVERALPEHIRDDEPDDDTCLQRLTEMALHNLAVATTDDVADYFRLPAPQVQHYLEQLPEAVPVRVDGWPTATWVHTERLTQQPTALSDMVTPLSPFDSLIWHRPRMRRLFGIEYLLEAYKPAAKRECGYFGLPVLAGDHIVGRVALRVSGKRVVIEGLQVVAPSWASAVDTAAQIAAEWAGATLDRPVRAKAQW
ncbi:DNA glycosylase AlkZ-like family protein [Streptomyces sp. NPDC058155]|uniref:DNA glycosylase AlkZ-like family protein n=1 Tax=Streptomyces sp. NPDC058155 TaxID=3346359 RepID=UPI0036EFD1F4